MIDDVNYLLVGNSRLHWAENLQTKYNFFHTQRNNKVPNNINLNKLIWASVGKLPDFCLKQENKLPSHPLFLKGYSTVGDWHSSSPESIDKEGRSTRFGGMKQELSLIHI